MNTLQLFKRKPFLYKQGVLFFEKFIKPKSKHEDLKRREFILNILILGSILLSLIANIAIAASLIKHNGNHQGLPLKVSFMIFFAFLALYPLSRKGFLKIASYILIFIYLLPVTYTAYKWGVDIPEGLMAYMLIVIMSGILINTRFASLIASIISLIIITLFYLQSVMIIKPRYFWRDEMTTKENIEVIVAIMMIIVIVSWLSNREIEKSLKRARASEAELQKERDLLEEKVEERTRELKKSQEEKALNLYRLAEFGKMSSELFHDLINPLSALSLRIENMKAPQVDLNEKCDKADQLSFDIERMIHIVESARKQVQEQKENIIFSLADEVMIAMRTLNHKAAKEGVKLSFYRPKQPITVYGNNVKFFRMASDLISNAIDSYRNKNDENKKVTMDLAQSKNSVIFTVKDWGCGIKEENIEKIFEPLFTTKDVKEGTGLGLYICKNIIEKDFKGSIKVRSKEGVGTVFVIKMPTRTYSLQNTKS